ncbi:sentrin-specific protease 6 [Oncorhynchus mykiss]|uniref:SUMO specific peptidase 6b n=1 Tax=Oncorhynchus mykiss TaxID=8022 RepID=A0A8C7RJK8_ONCMY|nr:sentrin-specific protease 6 [Oncorhynchus mykiss]XP_036818895.1 sentrin-specific protease 6 [Oncorhynchus mykiss]XP_036818896.1 sentrin-specific protease 6 [Oncorhynchus mykiss]XP_036818897.1 sentrin-specific protease 6 [Oncorhynchus mykiss]
MKKRCANQPLKRSLKGNAIGLHMLGIGKMPSSQTEAVHFSTVLNGSDYFFLSQVPSPGVVVQGSIFQHAFTPAFVLQNNAQRIDGTVCLQAEESPKKNPSLLQPAGDDKEETSVCSGTPTSGTSHSSPTPSGGSLETVADDDDFTSNYFTNSKTRRPRKKRMKDPFGKLVPDKSTTKRRRVKQNHPISPPPKNTSADISEGIDVFCRCVRVGTMRRTPSKHVTFTAEYIQIDEQVRLWSYSLASCAWCHARNLPALFLKTTSGESQRLRLLLKMSRANGGAWYDSKGQHLGENYIILVFENMLSDLEKVELEKIFRGIGRANKAPEDFTLQLPFVEANRILMHSSHPTPEKQVSEPFACPPKSPPRPASSFMHKVSQAISSPSKPPTSDAFHQKFLDSICGSSKQTPSSKPLAPRWIAPAPQLISLAPPRISLAPPQIYFALPRISPPPACLSPPPACLSPPPACLSPPPACLSPPPIQVLDDDEIMEIESTFKGPVKRIILYPPHPARGGISVTNEDLHCLNEGEFLNDVIIDFYLKYLVSAMLKEEDANRSHMFSSFFYKCLTQTEQRKTPCYEDLPVKKRRHNRVRTWTRNVDLFQKDFIFVPINESAHWFLAVICFPGLEDLQQEPLSPDSPFPAWLEEAESSLDKCFLMDYTSPNPMSLFFSPPGSSTRGQPGPEAPDCDLTIGVRLCVCSNGGGGEELESVMKELSVSPTTTGLIKKQLLSDDCNGYEIEKDIFAFSPVQDSNQDQCNESEQQDSVDVSSQPTTCKQPCILIMDSLGGHVRSGVVKILQEYLEVEWEVRKGSLRSFSKDSMRGSNPQVPQQDNYSDCGVYLLQYVESFFQNPPKDFEPPMDLKEWFPLMLVKRKRADIRKLVLKIQHQQEDTHDS